MGGPWITVFAMGTTLPVPRRDRLHRRDENARLGELGAADGVCRGGGHYSSARITA
jgi:hypothetical protein